MQRNRASQRPNSPENQYADTKIAVIARDRCRCVAFITDMVAGEVVATFCDADAVTVRYRRNIGVRSGMNPDALEAVCADCQVVTPADESGEYRPKRRPARRDRKAAA